MWNNKGMLQGNVTGWVLSFFGVGVVGAIFVIVLAALYDSTTNNNALGVINNTIALFTNFTSQFGTIGTVAGVLMLVLLIGMVGLFGYGVYQSRQR